MFSQLLWDNGREQARFLDNITDKRQTANDNLSVAFDKRALKRAALEARRPDYDKYVKHYKSKADAKRRARDKVIELASKDIDAKISRSLFYEVFPSKKKK